MKKARNLKPVITLFLGTFLFCLLGCGHQNPQARDWDDSEGWLGVHVQDLDRELRRYYDFEKDGVLVNRVVRDSPAEKSGIREEDLITRFDGKRIRDSRDLLRAVRRLAPGEKVEVELFRENDRKEFTVRLAGKPERRYSYRHTPRTYMHDSGRKPWLGVQMTDLNENLAEYFEVGENDGALILSVSEDSPAERAGLKAGDVIYEFDNEKIRRVEDVIDILYDHRGGDDVEVRLYRRGEKKKVSVELDRSRYSYHFDYHDRDRREWRHHHREMADHIRDHVRHQIRLNLHDNQINIPDIELPEIVIPEVHIPEIEIPEIQLHLEHIEDEIERELDGLDFELELEMRELSRELEKIEIDLRRFDNSI